MTCMITEGKEKQLGGERLCDCGRPPLFGGDGVHLTISHNICESEQMSANLSQDGSEDGKNGFIQYFSIMPNVSGS